MERDLWYSNTVPLIESDATEYTDVHQPEENEESDLHEHAHNVGQSGGCMHDHSDGGAVEGVFLLVEKDAPDHMHCNECGIRVEEGNISCSECGKVNIWI